MGLDALSFSSVTGFLAEFFGNGMVGDAIAAVIALGVGGFGVSVLIRAFSK